MAAPPPAFTLRVRVVAAAGLVCPSHAPVPWVQVAPGRGGFFSPQVVNTKHAQGPSPVWNESFDIPIADPAQDMIKFTLYDHAAQAMVAETTSTLGALRGPAIDNESWLTFGSAQGPRGQLQVVLTPLNFGVPPPQGPPGGHGVMHTPPPQGVVMTGPPPGHGMPPPGHGMPPPGHGMPPPGHGAPPPQHVVVTGAPPPQHQTMVVQQPGYGHPPQHQTVVVTQGHGKFKKGKFKHKKYKHKKHKKFKYKAPKIKIGKFKRKFKW